LIIVLTGPSGAGKSTVCGGVIKEVLDSGKTVGGVSTVKGTDGDLTVIDLLTGNTACLATKKERESGSKVCGYGFSGDGIQFGRQAIENAATADLLVVDEIGPLEGNGGGFDNVFGLLASGVVKNVVLVIREEMLPVFRDRLIQYEPVRVTPENRDSLTASITHQLFPIK